TPLPPAAEIVLPLLSCVIFELVNSTEPAAPLSALAETVPLFTRRGAWTVTEPALPLETLAEIVPSLTIVPLRDAAGTRPPADSIVPVFRIASESASPAARVTTPCGAEIVPLLLIAGAPSLFDADLLEGPAAVSRVLPSILTKIWPLPSRIMTSLPTTVVTMPPS